MFSSLFSSRKENVDQSNVAPKGVLSSIKSVAGKVFATLGITVASSVATPAYTQASPSPVILEKDLSLNISKKSNNLSLQQLPKEKAKQPEGISLKPKHLPVVAIKGEGVIEFTLRAFHTKDWEGKLVGTDGTMVVNDRTDLKKDKAYFWIANHKDAVNYAEFLKRQKKSEKKGSEQSVLPVVPKTQKAAPISQSKKPVVSLETKKVTKKQVPFSEAVVEVVAERPAPVSKTEVSARKLAPISVEKLVQIPKPKDQTRKEQSLEKTTTAKKLEKKEITPKAAPKKKETNTVELRVKKEFVPQKGSGIAKKPKETLVAKSLVSKEKKEVVKKLEVAKKPKGKSVFSPFFTLDQVLEKVEDCKSNLDHYFHAIGHNESGNSYDITNSIGASGRFQFIPSTLESLGLTPQQIKDFPKNPKLQERTMKKFTLGNIQYMTSEPVLTDIMRVGVQPLEVLAAMHHMGPVGVKKVAQKSIKSEDPASTFYQKLKKISDGNMSTRNYVQAIKKSYEVAVSTMIPRIETKMDNPIVSAPINIKPVIVPIITIPLEQKQFQNPVASSSETKLPSNQLKVIDLVPKKTTETSETIEQLPIKLPNTSRFDEVDPNADPEVLSNVKKFIPSAQNKQAEGRLKTTTGVKRKVVAEVIQTLKTEELSDVVGASLIHHSKLAQAGNIESLMMVNDLLELQRREEREKIASLFGDEDDESIANQIRRAA